MLNDDAVELMKMNGTYLVPTSYLSETADLDYLPSAMRKKKREIQPIAKESHRKAIAAGVKIAFGTDVGAPHQIAHGENAKEFGSLVRRGMTYISAIQSATIHAADLLGMSDRGVIEVGKRADIIATDGDPLKDISILENVSFVMKEGKIYKYQ
jgi:imidazolonepropionase-like amidohydrolase